MQVCVLDQAMEGPGDGPVRFAQPVVTQPGMTLARLIAEAQRLCPEEFAAATMWADDAYNPSDWMVAFFDLETNGWTAQPSVTGGLTVPDERGALYYHQSPAVVTVPEFQRACEEGVVPFARDRLGAWSPEGLGDGEDFIIFVMGTFPVFMQWLRELGLDVIASALYDLMKSYWLRFRARDATPEDVLQTIDAAPRRSKTLAELARELDVDVEALLRALPDTGHTVVETTQRVVVGETDTSVELKTRIERYEESPRPYWEVLRPESIEQVHRDEPRLRREYPDV